MTRFHYKFVAKLNQILRARGDRSVVWIEKIGPPREPLSKTSGR